MKKLCCLLFTVSIAATCNNNHRDQSGAAAAAPRQQNDTPAPGVKPMTDSTLKMQVDTTLVNLSRQVLTLFKNKNYRQLASLIHPAWKIRFSPYGHVDTLHDQSLSAEQLLELADNQKVLRWGDSDGTGEPILLSFSDYVNKFVYDADFLNAKETSVNTVTSRGNTLNNLQDVYLDAAFTEFYFPGFDPKYDGMDWKSLKLVFKQDDKNKYYLVAVVHDQWTI
jgi:hypothetical protein